ncbi:expressed unknown protein [Seminavis robusta]|uniref:tRNA-uridine aminocarboxypropyltransferase n=1 Tax=Seminavis robusta TaxID=568900 RepID=A0A9N8F0G6_9STRA|nr:expressed unknown protein [Seminavis robusta]|eukprot:Sro2446_g327960.1 n/a (387) ;mRNA; f:8354-9514
MAITQHLVILVVSLSIAAEVHAFIPFITSEPAFKLEQTCRARDSHGNVPVGSSNQWYRSSRQTATACNHTDKVDNDSLSHWLSSPELYAERLGLSVDQVQRHKQEHYAASEALQQQMKQTKITGAEKHQLICEHRYRHGKHPFVCPTCWCYGPICLCDDAAATDRIPLTNTVKQVILWTHHREWGSISNSGSLLPLRLDNTQLFMKGLPQHDAAFQKILDTNDNLVVLWPDNNDNNDTNPKEVDDDDRISWQDLETMLLRGNNQSEEHGLILIALEGTWRTARRMVSKLPAKVKRISLPTQVAFWNHSIMAKENTATTISQDTTRQSILQPLRRQEGGNPDNLCTAEAVTAALVGLGLPPTDGNQILHLVQKKVDRTRRYQGKRTR